MQTTPARLAKYKRKAYEDLMRHPNWFTYHDWRNHKESLTGTKEYYFQPNGDLGVDDDFSTLPGFRSELLTDDGFYTDYYEDNAVYGVVVVLRLGKYAYVIPGYKHSDWSGHSLYWKDRVRILARDAWDMDGSGDETPELYSTIRDELWSARRAAERLADKMREEDLEERVTSKCNEWLGEIKETRIELLALIKEFKRQPPQSELLVAALKEFIGLLRYKINTKRGYIKMTKEDPYSLVSNY